MTLVTPPSGPDFDVTDYEALAYYRREPGYVVHDGVSGPASTAPTLPAWAASTSYKAGQAVWISAGVAAIAQTTHVSGSTYATDKAAGKWIEVGSGTYASKLKVAAREVPPLDRYATSSVMASPPTITVSTSAPGGTLVDYPDARITKVGVLDGTRVVSGNTVYINTINGGTPSQATYSPFWLSFNHYGTSFTVRLMTLQASYLHWCYVDGHPVSARPSLIGSGLTVGAYYYVTFTFPTAAYRRIEYWVPSFVGYGGVYVGATDSVDPVKKVGPSVAILGDSWVEATGATDFGWADTFQLLSGWEVYRMGQGGTGYTNAGPGGQNKAVYGDASRTGPIGSVAPDYCIVFGSSNDDGASSATTGAAATALYAAITAASPNTKLIVVGPQSVGTGIGNIPAARTANSTAIHTAATAAGAVGFIDPLSDDSANAWIIGTGTSTAPAGSGNADIFANGSVAGHPTQAGHDYIARRVLHAVQALLAA